MQKREYHLTKVQKDLLSGIKRLAKEEGLEIKTIEVKWNEPVHKDVSDFLRKIDKAEKSAKNSKELYAGYQSSSHYNQQDIMYAA